GAALLAALVLTLAMTWWHAPFVRVHGRMENSVYDAEGIVPFGYTLFALGLALAVGAVWRRTVPAVVVGLLGYFPAHIFFVRSVVDARAHGLAASLLPARVMPPPGDLSSGDRAGAHRRPSRTGRPSCLRAADGGSEAGRPTAVRPRTGYRARSPTGSCRP